MTESAPAAPQPTTPLSASDDKLWASLAHLGGIFFILPSLLIYLILKDRGAKVAVEGKEALNFQILVTGSYIIALILATVSFGILFFLPFLVWVFGVVFSIIGFVKVNGGESYRYPLNIRFIK